ncbi:MAG: GntR family transcriptional regulator [Muribaculaceae bacterium]|nr:GntR family transcriptional regulator [Muribaculaceae bacterium]
MVKIGNYNIMRVERDVDFGVYLVEPDGDGTEILLPARYVPENVTVGTDLRVFIYTDSEDRLIATTEKPFATVGQFAFLQVNAVNRVGAFLDWGLPKDLLVPFKEQQSKMVSGGVYPVYVYLDMTTKRVAASARLEKYLGNVFPDYSVGQEVNVLVWKQTEIGYKVIVNNLHQGMIYFNEIKRNLVIGENVNAYVRKVREDGKLDLTLAGSTQGRVEDVAEKIMSMLKEKSRLSVHESSSPEEIKAVFDCSKKDFKRALGKLYKEHKLLIMDNEIIAVSD